MIHQSNDGHPRRRRYLFFSSLVVICVALPIQIASAAGLNLANTPLFVGSNVQPNLLLAIDDSGSMDYELLFHTFDGLLYWDKKEEKFATNSAGGIVFKTATRTYNDHPGESPYAPYAYLFPNGCDPNAGQRTICDELHLALPPLPAYGFARSPDFNDAYFDPTVEYKPWVKADGTRYPDSDPSCAFYEPTIDNSNECMDLTEARESTGKGKNFDFEPEMEIPAGIRYYHEANSATTGGAPPPPPPRHHRGDNPPPPPPDNETDAGFYSDDKPKSIDKAQSIGVSYYPATFYLALAAPPDSSDSPVWTESACKKLLPSDYGYQGEPFEGYGPTGEQPLCGFKIAPGTQAMQNFANWFIYYRKRHLAVRAGIAAAFRNIKNVYVGTCTINDRNPLEMRDLGNTDAKQAFYRSIFDFSQFSNGGGTPNRQALKFLGDQLESNSTIITSPCQRNYAILFTDGFTSGGLSGIGNVDNAYGPPFADDFSNTIADVAMQYYKNLVPAKSSLRNTDQVPVPPGCKPHSALDCEAKSHMVTFGVTLDQQGSIYNNLSQYPLQNADPYTHPPDWPNPNNNYRNKQQIDDLWHATINTRGKLVNAKKPVEIANAFTSALQTILGANASASGIASNSGSLNDNSVAYQATFVSGQWSGDLTASPVSADSIDSAEPNWLASKQLTQQDPDSRVILTALRNSTSATNNNDYQGVAFRPSSSLSASENAIIKYIRGDRSGERANGGDFRNRRDDILGDIVHSTPAYVGAPQRFDYPSVWLDLLHQNDPEEPSAPTPETPYSVPGGNDAFAQKYAKRTPIIYVGANDGMLHGFDASTGEEKLAYIPNAVIPDLAELTDPTYPSKHRYFVDGSPATGDVFFGGEWHTVLVGGLGNGGRNIYALDITNPGKFSESDPDATVLWEYTDTDLGKTFGKPSIVRLHNGEWAAIFGNGYNSDHEAAVLYVVDIADGHCVAKLATNSGSTSCNTVATNDSTDTPNGLSAPSPFDLDGDSITDYAYAGDLEGHLWKFDLTSTDPAKWKATKLFTATEPATDAQPQGAVQPITTRPQVGIHPYGEDYGLMVYFGTGKYLESDDATLHSAVRNSLYGIWDLDVFTFNKAKDGSPLFSTALKDHIPRDRLTQQTVLPDTATSDKRVVTNNSVDYQTTDDDKVTEKANKRGWVLDLPAGIGELIVSNPHLEGQSVSFSTRIPSQQSCKPGGKGYIMTVNSATGGRTDFAVFDLDNNHKYDSADKVEIDGVDDKVSVAGIAVKNGAPNGAQFTSNPAEGDEQAAVSTSDGGVTQMNLQPDPVPLGRRSWREIRR